MGNVQEVGNYQSVVNSHLDIFNKVISNIDVSTYKLEGIIKKLENNQSISQDIELESRFTLITFPLQEFEGKQRMKSIVTWFGRMTKEIFSSAFNKFQNGHLDKVQIKSYTSQNFLYNFLRLSKAVNLTKEELQMIDMKLKFNILPFLKLKYPLENSEVSLFLKNKIRQIDDLDNNENDLFFKSKIKFSLSDKKQYDSQLMQFLNYVIQMPSMEVQNQTTSKKKHQGLQKKQSMKMQDMPRKTENYNETLNKKNFYKDFYSNFQKLFQRLEIKQEVDEMEKNVKDYSAKVIKRREKTLQMDLDKVEKEKLLYKQKVQQYTKYFISKKLPDNIRAFKKEQVKDGNLQLNNPSLMRIVTKWCQQLRKNFRNSHQIAHKHSQFRMKDGSERYLCFGQSEILQQILERKQKNIINWLQKVRENNFDHQLRFSKENFIQDIDLAILSEEESSVGMFATVNQKNYGFYLTIYLKELIHHLLTAMDEFQAICFYYKYRQKNEEWEDILKKNLDEVIQIGKGRKKELNESMDSKTMNLITFKVSDLMRCKCYSREREIGALYTQLENLSRQSPEIMKIVKVKDRLQKGTRDVLLNILFKQKLLVELQLGVQNNHKSQFGDRFQLFNHFIYELERAEFGAISEICSVWMAYDPRANYFAKYLQNRHRSKIQTPDKSKQIQKEEIQTRFPFQCQDCKRYGSNAYPGSKEICIYCGLQKKTYKDILQIFPKLPKESQETERVNFSETENIKGGLLPESGLLIKLNAKQKQIKYFKQIKKGKKKFIIIKEHDNFVNLGEVSERDQQRQFLVQNLVFSQAALQEKMKNTITEKDVKTNYFIPKILREARKKQSNSIRIVHESLDHYQLEKIKEPLETVEKVNLSENKLRQIQQISAIFPKTRVLMLNNNEIDSIKGWEDFQHLEELNLQNNKLKYLHMINENFKEIPGKPLIKRLFLNSNELTELPQKFGVLKELEVLGLDQNQLSSLPQSFGELINLQSLEVNFNKLTTLPKSFGSLQKLRVLQFNSNQLKNLPDSFGGLLIKKLYLNFNKLESIPEPILSLEAIEELYLNLNKLPTLPDSFGMLKNLKILQLNFNKLSKLPKSFGNLINLQKLYLNSNQLMEMPKAILSLKNLSKLQINSNKLTTLPEEFKNLTNIQKLYLNSNRFKTFPQPISALYKLQTLGIESNQLTFLPQSFGLLKNLQKLYLNSNKFQDLPHPVLQLYKLNALGLDANGIKSLPESIGKLKNMKILYLNENKLTTLPQSLGKLQCLQKIFVNSNKLKKLPESLESLRNLQKLYLSSNEMTSVPLPILKLENLQTLDLQKNNLVILPESINKLSNIQTLLLNSNKITKLPSSLSSLNKLQQLSVDKNKLDQLSLKLCENMKKLNPRIEIKFL